MGTKRREKTMRRQARKEKKRRARLDVDVQIQLPTRLPTCDEYLISIGRDPAAYEFPPDNGCPIVHADGKRCGMPTTKIIEINGVVVAEG